MILLSGSAPDRDTDHAYIINSTGMKVNPVSKNNSENCIFAKKYRRACGESDGGPLKVIGLGGAQREGFP